MKRGIAVLLSVGALFALAYLTASKWAIRHETVTFYDADRGNRPVAVDVAVRRDKEMQADAGMLKLPVAVLNHGNTVKFTDYSFLANIMAARGYLVVSIQHDLPTDAPMVTKEGELYVGRLTQIERGVANIKFAVAQMESRQPNADYEHLTVVGHSMGGDITMYFAKQYPDRVRKVVTLDNLRVPFVTSGKFKILSVRSTDPQFKPDPGVVPDTEECEKAGITVVKTEFQHNDMRDTGSEQAKASIRGMLEKFLTDTDDAKDAAPVKTNAQQANVDPGPVAPYVPTGKASKPAPTYTH
jgi:alpha/beta hydrolase fold